MKERGESLVRRHAEMETRRPGDFLLRVAASPCPRVNAATRVL